MPEKIVIAEFDLDMEAAIKETIRLKEENVKLRATLKDVKESEGELSSEYIQGSAALKSNQAAIRTQEQLLIKATTATEAQAGSIDQLRAQLSIVSKQWSALSEAERKDSEIGKDLADQKLKLTDALKAEEKATGDNTRNVGNYQEAMIPLKVQLKEIIQQMQLLAVAGKDDGQKFIDLAAKAGKIKDAMNATNDQMKVFAVGNNFEQGLKVAKGSFDALSGAAQTYEGTLALLGAQNEEAAKVIQKLVALQSLQNGVTQVFDALQKESAFMLGVKTIALKVVTAAQWLWNAAIAAGALPLTLIIGSAAALGAGLVYLASVFVSNQKEISKTKLLLKQLDLQLQSSAAFDEYYQKILAAKGATDTDVTNQLIANAKNRIGLLVKEAEAFDKVGDIEGRKKAYEEANKLQDDLYVLEAQRQTQLKKLAEEKTQAEEDADKAYTELNIKNATIRYEMNKSKRDQALKDTQVDYDKLIETEKLLYSQGAAIAKKELDAGIKSRSEYNQQIQALEIERHDNIEELNRSKAEKTLSDMNFELEVYKLNNKSKLKSNEDLTSESIAQEKIRLDKLAQQEEESLKFQYENKLITLNDYNTQVLQLEDANQVAIQDLRTQYDEQEKQRKIDIAQTNFENEQALFDENVLAQLDKQRAANEQKKAEELKTAEKIGADKSLIEKKYSKANIILNRAERDAKLNLAQGFASNIATIAGENTKVGKAAAVAAATINTYQAATGAYAALAPIPIVGPALGIAAAAAAVISGISNVKKILATQPGSTPSAGSDNAQTSQPQLTSSLQSANTDIGAGIVSRNTETGQASQGAKVQSVLVVDKVTNAQKVESSKADTATI